MTDSDAVHATLIVNNGNAAWAELQIVNHGDEPLSIHNPGSFRPTEGWEYSLAAYNIAVLLSFHFLSLNLLTAQGDTVKRNPIIARADHLVPLPLELQPESALTIRIPLHEFFDLKRGTDYLLQVAYGDHDQKVRAETNFHYG